MGLLMKRTPSDSYVPGLEQGKAGQEVRLEVRVENERNLGISMPTATGQASTASGEQIYGEGGRT